MLLSEEQIAVLNKRAEEQVVALKELMFEYLGAVRDSGLVNMLGVCPSLEAEFGLTRSEAKAVLVEWIKAYGEEQP